MRSLVCILSLSSLLSGAAVLDRIAVIAGTHVIKLSDINRVSLNFSPSVKRESAELSIGQTF
jgi:hypothetical protein